MFLSPLGSVGKQSRNVIDQNVLRYLWECCQIFRGMPPNILEIVLKHSGECLCYSRKWERRFSPIIIIKTLFTLGLKRKIYKNGMITAKRLPLEDSTLTTRKMRKLQIEDAEKLVHPLLWI